MYYLCPPRYPLPIVSVFSYLMAITKFSVCVQVFVASTDTGDNQCSTERTDVSDGGRQVK